jgi:hypothetical protein
MSENRQGRLDCWIRSMPTTTKKSSSKGRSKVKKVMREYKHGELKSGKSGKGGKVKSRKQAIAIGLSEARKSGAKVPPKKKSASKKSSAKKSSTRKSAKKK